DRIITAVLSLVFKVIEEEYPPVPPLCQIISFPLFDFNKCQPKPIFIFSLMLEVGVLVNVSSLFFGLNWASANFTNSSVVDKIPLAPTNTTHSQLGVISPFGFSPFTRLSFNFSVLTNEFFILYLSKTLFCNNF